MRTKVTSPIVIDLGKTRRADVDELRNGAGRLIIHFFSDEELQGIYEAIVHDP